MYTGPCTPRLMRRQTSKSVQWETGPRAPDAPTAAGSLRDSVSPGMSARAKVREEVTFALLMRSMAMVLPRGSVALSGLYQYVELGHSHQTPAAQSQAGKRERCCDLAKMVPEWPA